MNWKKSLRRMNKQPGESVIARSLDRSTSEGVLLTLLAVAVCVSLPSAPAAVAPREDSDDADAVSKDLEVPSCTSPVFLPALIVLRKL